MSVQPGPHTEPQAVPPHTPPRQRLPLRVAVALLAIAGIAVGIIALTGGFSHAAPPPKPTFTLRGSITLMDPNANLSYHIAAIRFSGNDSCQGTGPYSDLSAGTAVVVADPQGRTVATGALETGIIDPAQGAYASPSCVMGFSVPDVPDGLSSYSVTVSHRGTQVVPPSEAHAGMALTIGGN